MAVLFFEDPQIALIILLAETILILALITSWILGARRLNITLHHRVVYSAIPANLTLILLWMLPKPLKRFEYLLKDPVKNWNLLAHYVLGAITISLAVGIILTFIVNREIPLVILRRARPIMIAILFLWIVTFSLGAWNYYNRYLVSEEEENEDDDFNPYPSSSTLTAEIVNENQIQFSHNLHKPKNNIVHLLWLNHYVLGQG
ncbi:MAG: hypothetical protein ACE5OZ_03925 [Candidatus Heimdallarchaeota archaeon]